jgi:hypothetical protein
MLRIIVLASLLGVVSSFQPASAETTFIGHATANVYSGVNPPCPNGEICMDTWYRWTIKVESTLSGPQLPGVIVAARLQHTEVVPRYLHELRLFVVKPIEEREQRELLRADYVLEDQSRLVEMHCLETDPRKLGLAVDDVFVNDRGRYCFELPKKN